MLDGATELDALVMITRPLRAAVVENETIGWVSSGTGSPPGRHVAELVDVTRSREVGESIEYGLFALVDIAIMALSPAVNDPNSAVEVIEEMSFLFAEIAEVPLGPYAIPDADSWPCVVVNARRFGELVELATTQIVLYDISDPKVAQALRRNRRRPPSFGCTASSRRRTGCPTPARRATLPPTPRGEREDDAIVAGDTQEDGSVDAGDFIGLDTEEALR